MKKAILQRMTGSFQPVITLLKKLCIAVPFLICFVGGCYTAEAGNAAVKHEIQDLFVTQHISHDTLFVNQQAIHTILFFRRVKTTNARVVKSTIKNFHLQDLEIEKEYEKIVGGTSYLVTELRYAIFPLVIGTYQIPSVKVSCDVIARSGDDPLPFSESGEKQQVVISSRPLRIKVIPLPKHPKPAGSSSLVGTFSLSGALSDDHVMVGDSVTLTVTLKGTGNLYELARPTFPTIKACRIYQDRPTVELQKTREGISGTQTFKIAIIPTNSGTYVIPPVSVSFFDPLEGHYRELFTKPIQLSVLTKNALEADIFDKTSIKAIDRGGQPIYYRTGVIWGFALVVVATLASFFYIRKQKYHNKSPETDRSRNALKRLKKELTTTILADPGRLHHAFKKYLEDSVRVPVQNLTPTEIEALLLERSVAKDLTARTIAILNMLDMVRFSGRKSVRLFQPGIIQEIEQTARNLERALAAPK